MLHHYHQSFCNNHDVHESRNAAPSHQLALSRNRDPSQTEGKSTPARSTIIMKKYYILLIFAQTLLCSGQVANPTSLVPAWLELQLVVLKLTVKAEVPAIVCRSMFEILHSPIAKLNVAHLDKHWEHKGWSAPSHALSEASIITSQQEATSASGWFGECGCLGAWCATGAGCSVRL